MFLVKANNTLNVIIILKKMEKFFRILSQNI